MERLTEILKDENVLEEVLEREEIGSYQKYQNLYKNNQAQLIAEGRAKLIGRHILKNEQARYNNNIINKALNWLKNAFNTIFKKANPDTLQYKLNAADVEASKFAVKVMNGEVELSIDFDSMNNKHIMYNAAKDVSNKKETLKKILFTETKRKNILEKSKKLNLEEQEHLKKLGSNLDTYNRMLMMEREDEGILGFLEDAYKEMQEVMNDTEGLKIDKNMHNLSIQRAAKYLRKLKNFVDAYESISKEMFNYTESNEYKENVAKGQYVDITVNMQQFTYLLKQAERQYEKMSKPLFFEFIKPFAAPLMGQQIKGNKVDEAFLENMLTEAKQDIGFMDRWIVSMAQSSDLMLRLIEQPIKHINQQIRGKVIKKLQILQKAQEDLEKAGYSDTSFVYERDGSGHLTGRYVQEIDWARYGKEKNDFYEKLNKKYDKSKDST